MNIPSSVSPTILLTFYYYIFFPVYFLFSSIPNSHFPQQHSSRLHDDNVIVCMKSVIPAPIDMITAESAASIYI